MEEFILITWFKGGDFPLPYLSGPSAASLPSSFNCCLVDRDMRVFHDLKGERVRRGGLEKKFPMHDFRVEAHGSIIDVSLAAYFTMVKESELILRSLMPLLLQHMFGSRNSIPDELQKLVEVEVETGMIDGEMDAISSCSLFSNFLFANAGYGVFGLT
ncbi:unnamed protein product [Prunus armeniaca]